MSNPVGEKAVKITGQKLLDQVRDAIRVKHYSIRTEEACVNWIKCFILLSKSLRTGAKALKCKLAE